MISKTALRSESKYASEIQLDEKDSREERPELWSFDLLLQISTRNKDADRFSRCRFNRLVAHSATSRRTVARTNTSP